MRGHPRSAERMRRCAQRVRSRWFVPAQRATSAVTIPASVASGSGSLAKAASAEVPDAVERRTCPSRRATCRRAGQRRCAAPDRAKIVSRARSQLARDQRLFGATGERLVYRVIDGGRKAEKGCFGYDDSCATFREYAAGIGIESRTLH